MDVCQALGFDMTRLIEILLDEAFAEVGARTAKGEALRRAFEASGRSVAEFAEMYGMDARAVAHALARARRLRAGGA